MMETKQVSNTSDPVDTIVEAEDDSFGILERPKRPLSAYNLFFRDEREKLLQSLPSREPPSTKKSKPKRDKSKCHRKIDFSDLAKTIASRWKQVDESVKKEYEDIANAGRIVYNEKAKAWREQRKALGLSTKREMKKKSVQSNLQNKVIKAVAAPPSNTHQSDLKARLDLGPKPRSIGVDPHQQVSSLQDNSPTQVNYYKEVRTEPAAAFSTPGDFLEEPLDPFADSMAPSASPYGREDFSDAQLDFPYSCQPGWMPVQEERILRAYYPSLNTSAYPAVPNTRFDNTYRPHSGHNVAWRSAVAGGSNGDTQTWYSPQQASYAMTQYQNNYCTTHPVHAFDD